MSRLSLACRLRPRWAWLCCALLSAICASEDDAPAELLIDDDDVSDAAAPPPAPPLPPEALDMDAEEEGEEPSCAVLGASSVARSTDPKVSAAALDSPRAAGRAAPVAPSPAAAPVAPLVLPNSVIYAGGASVHDRLTAAGFADPEKAPTKIGGMELWTGEFMGMSSHQVVALTEKSVIACFGRGESGGCKCAAVNSSWAPAVSANSTGDTESKFLPALPWGPTHAFHDAEISRVELERLGAAHFVICYQRTSTGVIACNIGAVDEEGTALQPFSAALELGRGQLVALSVSMGGRQRFAVCFREAAASVDNAQSAEEETLLTEPTRCRWAEASGDAEGGAVDAKWLDSEPMVTVAR